MPIIARLQFIVSLSLCSVTGTLTQNISYRAKKFIRKVFKFAVFRLGIVLRAGQKSNGVCVHTKPPSAPFSSRFVQMQCSNCYGKSDVFKQFRFGVNLVFASMIALYHDVLFFGNLLEIRTCKLAKVHFPSLQRLTYIFYVIGYQCKQHHFQNLHIVRPRYLLLHC